MTLRDELLGETIAVKTHELDGKIYRFKAPTVEAQQRVLNVGGLTDLPGLNAPKKGAKPGAPRRMALGRMKVQALVETLLNESDALAFGPADVEALMAAPLGSKIEKLASWAWENLFRDTDDDAEEDAENPS